MAAALLAALPLLVAPAPAVAQAPGPGSRTDTAVADTARTDTFALPGIVVTATRVPLPREALPVPVSVWSGDELEERGVRTVAEALQGVPAAAVTRAGSPGAQTSLFLRGGESDYVKVLIDGVAVNDPGGAVDLADLTIDQVERIEVVRGPASVLYGSDAVAGVVQIFTRRPTGAPRVTARLMGGAGQERAAAGSAAGPEAGTGDGGGVGTYGLLDAAATATGSVGALGYALGGGRSWSQGLYPFNNDRAHNTGSLRLSWRPGPAAGLAVNTRYSDSRSHFPTDGTGALVDRNAYLDRETWTASAVAGFRLHDRVDARVRAGLNTRNRHAVDAQDGPADTLGVYASTLVWDLTRRSVDARVDAELPDALGPGSVLSVGAAWEESEAGSEYTSDGAFGPFDAAADYRRTTVGYYLQLLSEPVSGVHITAGGRLDDSDTYGAFRTYRVGAAAEPVAGTRLRGALGRGFKEPSFDQSFGSGFGDTGNPGLEPEESRSWEAGIEQSLTAGPIRATLSATWFDQRFDRLIQFTFGADPGEPSYFNVGAASARGLELELHADHGRLGIDASYTYLETEVLDPGLATDAGFVEGEPLLRRPTHAATVTGRYTLDAGAVTLAARRVGDREDLDFAAGFPAPRVTLPAHTTVDASVEHALPLPGPATKVLLRIENVLDEHYQSIAGFPGLGRVVRVGARVRVR